MSDKKIQLDFGGYYRNCKGPRACFENLDITSLGRMAVTVPEVDFSCDV